MGNQRTIEQPPRVPNARNRLQTRDGKLLDPCSLTVVAANYSMRGSMLSFMGKHYRTWTDLTDEPSFSIAPEPSEYTRIQIGFDLDIEPAERHYLDCLARWMALRIGKRKTYPRLGVRTLHPAVYYDSPQDAWLVLREWNGPGCPEAHGVGSVCDEDGFLSQVNAFDRTALRLTQDTRGASEGMRYKRGEIVALEQVVKAELSRLSGLWRAQVSRPVGSAFLGVERSAHAEHTP